VSFANPAALWLLGLLVPVVAVHVLRPRRQRVEVSSTFLWDQIAEPVAASSPWQRLRPSWLLLAQLLAVALLALILARPSTSTTEPLADHTVFIIDASGSMEALEGSGDRLDLAVERILAVRSELPDGGRASLVVAGRPSRVLLTRSTDVGELRNALGAVRAMSGTPDFGAAFSLAESLEAPGEPIGFVLVSDGGVAVQDRSAIPAGTRYERIGTDVPNRAVTQLSVVPAERGLSVTVTARHLAGPAATQTLRIDVDGRTVDELEVSLERGRSQTFEILAPPGDLVTARLDGGDALMSDDVRSSAVSQRRDLVVFHGGARSTYVGAALLALPGVRVVDDPSDPLIDVAVVEGAGGAGPEVPTLAFGLPGGLHDVAVLGSVENPVIALVRNDDPLLAGLDLSEVVVGRAQVLDPGVGEVLVAAEGAPLLVRTRSSDGADGLYFALAAGDSTLPLFAQFPVLIDRALTELAGAIVPPAELESGSTVSFDSAVDATVTTPSGASLDVPARTPRPVVDELGIWEIRQAGRRPHLVSVVQPLAESATTPEPSLPIEILAATDAEVRVGERDLWRWFGLALGAVLLLEWALARRQIGVPRRQWRVAQLFRLAVACLLVLALVEVSWTRAGNDVATVFVVDESESLGRQGRRAASDWIRQALASTPSDGRAGVVAFGARGRIESVVQSDPTFGGVSVAVDRSATDLADALRLAAAMSPTDMRRRVVLLTDGRETEGDALGELAGLAEQGIAVDTVLVSADRGLDVAVGDLDVPSRAEEGDDVVILVPVDAPTAVAAELVLFRNGEQVSSQRVEVDAGRSVLRLVDSDATIGLARYRVSIRAPGDLVAENDTATAAVAVTGPSSTLVIEGRRGDAEALVAALRSTGMAVQTTGVDEMPSLEEASVYEAVVLVDVDRRALADEHVAMLGSVVRDLGRGLVVIGGDQSFGLGGYLGSDLEELLPVVAEITDPRRRQTVAEVLAIDTSGSMGACHCREGQLGGFPASQIDGGVNKTDISRSAATRAIAALSSQDEIGVLAFDATTRWLLDLQAVPGTDAIDAALGRLTPEGGTFIEDVLATSAAALRESSASLKHVVVFSDGFTDPGDIEAMATEAAELAAEGITVSVIATGEGSARELAAIARAGGGRFYPGRNLQAIPEILVEETIIASRELVNEGDFVPVVTGIDASTQNLTAAPSLQGFVGVSEKPGARTLLRIGPEQDPLLATWRTGLGTVSAWSSDAGTRWTTQWPSWDGYATFWASVVRETFPDASGDAGVSALVSDGRLRIEFDVAEVPTGAVTAVARIGRPDGTADEFVLDRVGAERFAAEVAADDAGVYAVGVSLHADGEPTATAVTTANRSYSDEFRPGEPREQLLRELSAATGGRLGPAPENAFDAAGLTAGRRVTELTSWLLAFALAALLVAIAVSRLSFRGTLPTAAVATRSRELFDRMKAAAPMEETRSRSGPDSPSVTTRIESHAGERRGGEEASTEPSSEPDQAAAEDSTLGRLLDRKRRG